MLNIGCLTSRTKFRCRLRSTTLAREDRLLALQETKESSIIYVRYVIMLRSATLPCSEQFLVHSTGTRKKSSKERCFHMSVMRSTAKLRKPTISG